MDKRYTIWVVLGSVVAVTVVGLGVGLTATVIVPERNAANYVGTKLCGICHKRDDMGNQIANWEASPHARAFERLATPEAKEIAKKLGIENPQTNGKCLRCHATSYNFTETPAAERVKPEEGVTCESCHGAGKDYMKKYIMENRKDAIGAGLVDMATKRCAHCHNDQGPMWKPDRYTTKDGRKVGFDAELAYEKIKHPNPRVKQQTSQ